MITAARTRPSYRGGRAGGLALAAFLAAVGVGLAPSRAEAGPREDLKAAYDQAQAQFGNLELDLAQQGLEGAISRAQSQGLGTDPALAPLLVLRAGIIFSNTGQRGPAVAAFEEAVRADYFIAIPIELRSADLQSMLDEARRRVGAAPRGEPIAHTIPTPQAGEDLAIEAQMRVTMMEGFQAALYWRKAGEADYRTLAMQTFGNLAWATVPASEHGDKPLEYAIYAFDANQAAIANKGDTDHPIKVEFPGSAAPDAGGSGDEGDGNDKKKEKDGVATGKKIGGFLNIGLGTGFGLARGTAEQTYQQYTPADPGFAYTPREQACALARWWAPDGELPSANAFAGQTIPELQAAGATLNAQGLPGPLDGLNPAELMANYDQGYCSQRHPIAGGMASAPFHVAPEIGITIKERVQLSLFSRLQVVTGSKVYRGDDPKGANDLALHYNNSMRAADAGGVGEISRPPFTWALGLKVRGMLRAPGKKFRPFLGGFVGYGAARYRVNMGFANDRNGNSVPDDQEVALDQVPDPMNPGSSLCVPVFPYGSSCQGDAAAMTDQTLAQSQLATADKAPRIDTVRAGPAFVGALVGFNYQIVKHFAFYSELHIGGWFNKQTSLLFDLTIGPSITF